MSSVHVARQGFITKSALPSVSRERGSTTVADNRTVLLLNGNGANGAQNNTFLDSSTNNFSITRNGNATQGSFSPFTLPDGQWSNYFDGTGDYLSVPAISTLATSFTIEFWAYFSNADSTRFDFFALGGSAVLYRPTGNTLNWFIGSDRISGSFNLATYGNRWNHIAICRDSSNNTRLFVNGTQLGSTYTSDTSTYSSTGPTIGWNSGGGHVNGHISNFRILSGTALYTSAFTPPTTPLTAVTNTSLLTCQSNRFRDKSSNNFAITRNGDVRVTPWSPFAPTSAYDPATNGGSGYFDGNGDYVTAPIGTAFDLGTTYTIEAWVYPNVTSGFLPIFNIEQSSVTNFAAIILAINNGQAYFEVRPTQGASVTSITSGTITTGQWHHVAISVDNGSGRLFLNGTQVGSTTTFPNLQTREFVGIGANGNGVSTTTQAVNGYISNLRVVKGTAVYTSAFTPPTAPVTNITNTSLLLNFTNAGIFDAAGDQVLETVANAQISTSVKKYGSGSLAFDGSGDYIKLPPSTELNMASGSFTVEFWMYPNSVANSAVLMTGSTTNFTIQFGNTFSDQLIIYDGSNRVIGAISTGTWTHFALVRNGSTLQGYINGVASGSSWTNSSSTLFSFSGTGVIGARSGGSQFFNGYIDDLRITKGQARYTADFTPPTSELALFGTVPNIVNNSTYGVYQLA